MKFRSIEHAESVVSRCICHCGRLRIRTSSGLTCPDHRIVLQGATDAELSSGLNAKWILGLPKATRTEIRGQWRISGRHGRYRRTKIGGRYLVRRHQKIAEGCVAAVVEGKDGLSVFCFEESKREGCSSDEATG